MRVKRVILSVVLALALCVPIAKPGFVSQTTVSCAKYDTLGKKVNRKNYKKIKKGMSYKAVCKVFQQVGTKEETKYVGDDKYVLYSWCNYKKHIWVEIWFENGKSDVKYYDTY